MLFFPVFSVGFYIIYILCGFSDMIDGTIARKTNSADEFGAKIDTVADIVFVTVSFIKILPAINVPYTIWIWGALIAVIKIGNIILGYVYQRRFISLHTVMNRITGLLLFLLPLTLSFADVKYTAVTVCSVATFAAIHEGACITTNRKSK